ncbi:MAG: hypothetical protein ACRD2L_04990 [Terriglobia bacterium]
MPTRRVELHVLRAELTPKLKSLIWHSQFLDIVLSTGTYFDDRPIPLIWNAIRDSVRQAWNGKFVLPYPS